LGYHLDCNQVRISAPAQSIDPALSSLFNAVDIGRVATREDKILANGTELEAVFTTVPVDFAQLQSPLQADAYLAAQFVKCPFGCSSINPTVLEHEFFPTLVIPSLFQRLDPAWSSCIVSARVKDPPLAFPVAATMGPASLNPIWRYVPTSTVASPGAIAQPTTGPTQGPQISHPLADPSRPYTNGDGQPASSFVVVVKTLTITTKQQEQDDYPQQARTSPATLPTSARNQALLTLVSNMVIIGSVNLYPGDRTFTTLGHTISILSNGILNDGLFVPFPVSSLTALPVVLSVYPNGSVLLSPDHFLAGSPQATTRAETVLMLDDGMTRNLPDNLVSDSEFFHIAMPGRQETITGGSTDLILVGAATGLSNKIATATSTRKKNHGEKSLWPLQPSHLLLIMTLIFNAYLE
jgi:hypothetical protein